MRDLEKELDAVESLCNYHNVLYFCTELENGFEVSIEPCECVIEPYGEIEVFDNKKGTSKWFPTSKKAVRHMIRKAIK